MPKRRSDALLAFSVGLFVAAVIGVRLGHSAIADINPIHFRGAPAPPRGIDPNAAPPPADGFASAFDWNAGRAARDFECGGNCDAREVRQAAAQAIRGIRSPEAAAPWWRDATPVAEAKPWPPGETGGRRLSVERYMHYPIEQAPAEAEAPAAAEEAETGTVAIFRGGAAPSADGRGEK